MPAPSSSPAANPQDHSRTRSVRPRFGGCFAEYRACSACLQMEEWPRARLQFCPPIKLCGRNPDPASDSALQSSDAELCGMELQIRRAMSMAAWIQMHQEHHDVKSTEDENFVGLLA